ncbi:blue copper protein 1a-like [Diospyros lotus]|uniref:blue copper protein 1a-like n=1 Tax=Diospyros lotus TaxID=55363 RepID=UPI002256FFA0|nr:blue copper protein 1a-like [Diospyros lotus]
MASSSSSSNKLQVMILAAAVVLLIICPSVTVATQYWVGDSAGWTIDFNYTAWAQDKAFYVGDSLVFKYTQGDHNVFKVNATAFKDCIKPPLNESLATGHDEIKLLTAGRKWYICGVATHCADHNQKLVITVVETPASAPAPQSDSAHRTLTSASSQLLVVFLLATIPALLLLA